MAGPGEICEGEQDLSSAAEGPRGILCTCLHPQLPRLLRHTLNIRARWCQLPLAGLGHSCGGLPLSGGTKFRFRRGRALGAGRDLGVQGEGSEQETGVLWAAAVSLGLTGPARGLFTPLGVARRGQGLAGVTQHRAGICTLTSDFCLLPQHPG